MDALKFASGKVIVQWCLGSSLGILLSVKKIEGYFYF